MLSLLKIAYIWVGGSFMFNGPISFREQIVNALIYLDFPKDIDISRNEFGESENLKLKDTAGIEFVLIPVSFPFYKELEFSSCMEKYLENINMDTILEEDFSCFSHYATALIKRNKEIIKLLTRIPYFLSNKYSYTLRCDIEIGDVIKYR